MMTSRTTSNRGFTLVETMVAITILVVAIIGPYDAVEHALAASYQARDELAATALAQEGVEYAYGLRDNNFLCNLKNPASTVNMLYGLDGSSGTLACTVANARNCTAPNWCTIDPGQSAQTVCATSGTTGCPSSSALYLANGTGGSYLYNQASNGTVTRFTRSLQLSSPNAQGEVIVNVLVSWNNQGPHSVKVTDVLDNWL